MKRASFVLLLASACTPAVAPPVASPPVAKQALVTEASSPAPSTSTPPPAAEPAAPVVDPRTARLVRLCTLWGKVRYLHPWVVEGTVDWDAALVAALPKALAAQNDDDEAAAARVMLDALHDPSTRVENRSTATPPAQKAPAAAQTRTVDGVVIVPVALGAWDAADATAARVEKDLATAKLAVIDLRGTPPTGDYWKTLFGSVGQRLTPHPATGLASRVAEHRGYRQQEGITSGGYGSVLATDLAVTYPAAPKLHLSRVVFLTTGALGLPDVAWAMQRNGDATVVVQGALGRDEFVATDGVPLGGSYVAVVRESELTQTPPQPDLQLPADADDATVIAAAVRAAKRPAAPKAAAKQATTAHLAAWHPDELYADEPYPSRERRMLALFRFWNVIDLFYPYLPLMGDAWDEALVEFIPRFESAADANEYARAIAELAARIPDGHVNVWGGKGALKALRGRARAPFEARMIEGRPVVTALRPGDASVAAAGLHLGDVIVSADGEPIDARIAKAKKYKAASNETWGNFWGVRTALTGDDGSTLRLTVQDASGAARDVQVTRTTDWQWSDRTGPVYRLIDDEIGYADLDRLENSDVDAMFAAFEKTRAIVFDMRGYPHGTAWTVGPRLNVRHARVAAQFFEPFVSLPGRDRTFFEQPLGFTDKPLYRGKTVMLVDERTMSQAEHTGLFFEAANGTTFIGSQTAGANGDVTNLSLPGGYYVSFSGHDVRHADGRQLQRVGIVPDVEVHPTIGGIRAGRDEVLDRALEYVRSGK